MYRDFRVLVLATVTFAGCWAGHATAAEPVQVTGDAVREAVAGKTVDLDTPLGRPITITYKDNGTLSATAGAALGIYLGASSDRGKWWVENGRLCQKFFKWLEAETNCLRLKQDGRRIFWTRDDGRTGTATVYANAAVRNNPPVGVGGPGLGNSAFAAMSPPPKSPSPVPAATPKAPSESIEPATKPRPASPPITSGRPAPQLAVAKVLRPAERAAEPSIGVSPAYPVPTPVALRADPDPPRASRTEVPLARPEWPALLPDIEQGRMVKQMLYDARRAHSQQRWCRDIGDVGQPPARAQTNGIETPVLLTAWRHMVTPDASPAPAASCLVPAPVLLDIARQLLSAP